MVKVFRIGNAFAPKQDLRETEVEAGCRLADVGAAYKDSPWLCVAYLGGRRFCPLREEWDHIELKDGDVVYFMPYVAGFDILIWAAIAAVAAVSIALAFMKPPEVGQVPNPDDVFNLSNRRNQNRLGQPIEDGYGKNRIFPSYAATPYNQYVGNDQIQYQLFCLGHGSWDVTTETDADHGVYIEDTPIENFQETETEIILPGGSVTLFPTNVETSVEVADLELISTDGWHTFTANAANTDAYRLEVDIAFPAGLYYANNGGGLNSKTITLEFEYREIDDSGTPVGSWTTLNSFSKTLATSTPQRFTVGLDIADGRSEVRGRRTDTKDTSHRAAHTAKWVGLRAFKTETRNYGDVTLLAVKARATNNLNDRSSNRINVIATRMLPDWDGGTGTLAAFNDTANRTASRNPVWAFVNVVRASYGAAIADSFLDLDFLATEAAAADTDGITFDHVFSNRITTWEAAKTCLFPFKSIPIPNGSLVTMSRDKPATLPVFHINPENTVAGSFKLIKRLLDSKEPDGLIVEYLDETTWKMEEVSCLLGGEAGNNPQNLRVPGVINRQNAYELGMYLRSIRKLERDEVQVTTGLEGFIPFPNDLGRIGSDVTQWGTNGYVKSQNGQTLTLSEDVTFEVGETYKISLRGKLGQDLGPYTVTAGASANEVIVDAGEPLPAGQFFYDGNREPPYFIFGKSATVGRVVRVLKLSNAGQDQVRIVAVVDDQSRFADPGTAPALTTTGTPPKAPDAPTVSGLSVEAIPHTSDRVTARWLPAFGATHYLIQTSPNGTDWVELTNTTETFKEIGIIPGETLYVRVAAVNVGIGAWDTWNGALGDFGGVPFDVDGLEVNPAFTGRSVNLIWQAAQGATSYEIKVYVSAVLKGNYEVFGTSFQYTFDDAETDGAVARSIDFEVKGKNSYGTSATADTVTATNAKPAAPTNPFTTETMDVTDFKEFKVGYDEVTDSDVKFYRIWASETSGFTPGSGNLVYEGLGRTFDIRLKKTGGSITTTYWRAAAIDVWDDTDYNTTAEQTIS